MRHVPAVAFSDPFWCRKALSGLTFNDVGCGQAEIRKKQIGEFGAGRPDFGGRWPRGEALGQKRTLAGLGQGTLPRPGLHCLRLRARREGAPPSIRGGSSSLSMSKDFSI